MYPDINWNKEPDLAALREAYSMVDTDVNAAIFALEALANRGSIASMWYLGDIYSNSKYHEIELRTAKAWFERAEANGWLPGSYYLGRTCFKMHDYKSSFDAFVRGATKGHPAAQYRLAMMYRDGLSPTEDKDECFRLLQASASSKHLFAIRELSTLCIRGYFGAKNIIYGLYLFINLIFSLITITVKREWSAPGFEDRILA